MAAPAATPRDDRTGVGILLMLTASAFFALTDTSVKWLVLAGLPAMQLAFVRYLVSFLLSLGNGIRHGQVFPPLPRRDVALVVAAAVVICFVATIYPSRQAARLDPAEGLRHD